MNFLKEYRVNNVTKVYGDRIILDRVNFDIETGQRVAIMGPSGVGKTTLIKILSARDFPDSGEVYLAGKPTHEFTSRSELSSKIGVIHQQYDLVPNLSVLQNVLAGSLGRWNFVTSLVSLFRPNELENAMQAIDQVGLNGYESQKTLYLSGGEQQRTAIARLLVQDPEIILADEPIAALDPRLASQIMDVIVGTVEAKNKTLIASMHSVEATKKSFHRVLGIKEAQIYFDVQSEVLDDGIVSDLFGSKK